MNVIGPKCSFAGGYALDLKAFLLLVISIRNACNYEVLIYSQSVLNAAARLIFRLKSSDHITHALISLHWLRVPERIQYKVAVMAYKVLDVHQVTSGHLYASPMYLIVEHSAPPARIAS